MFRGRPIYYQDRIGLDGGVFRLYKFRSMQRGKVTGYGAILRKTSLDELPQLFLVLIGQMSLIGPRPLLPEYMEKYSEAHKVRHKVKPGLTGLAQVNGRNNTTWQERLDFDVEYVNSMSFELDIKIFFRSFWVLVSSRGVSDAQGELMQPFTGL